MQRAQPYPQPQVVVGAPPGAPVRTVASPMQGRFTPGMPPPVAFAFEAADAKRDGVLTRDEFNIAAAQAASGYHLIR